MNLSDNDVEKIAERLVTKVRESGHEFWIDPKAHYDQHQELKKIQRLYDTITSKIGQGVVWLIFLGAFVLIALGMGFKKL